MKWFIYKITNPVGQVYIGKTRCFEKRIAQYKRRAHPNHGLIYKSIVMYGFDNHVVEQIDSFISDEDYADGKEMLWIRANMANANKWPEMKGLNLTNGGKGPNGRKASEKQRLTAATVHKGNKYTFGRVQSEKEKIKRAGMLRGQKRTVEQRNATQEINLKLRGKRIIQIEENGNFIKEFDSIVSASKELKINRQSIRFVLSGNQDSIKGLYFKYK